MRLGLGNVALVVCIYKYIIYIYNTYIIYMLMYVNEGAVPTTRLGFHDMNYSFMAFSNAIFFIIH